MRHAKAEDRQFARDDRERELVEKGRQAVRKIMNFLGEQFAPDLIIASNYVRAQQTAEIACLATESSYSKSPEVLVAKELGVDSSWAGWRRKIPDLAADFDNAETVLLVGHEPSISEILAGYLGCDELPVNFRKSAVAVLLMDGYDSGCLLAFVPHQYVN